jgi:hypothetical protein
MSEGRVLPDPDAAMADEGRTAPLGVKIQDPRCRGLLNGIERAHRLLPTLRCNEAIDHEPSSIPVRKDSPRAVLKEAQHLGRRAASVGNAAKFHELPE